jgi:hypothetical protein
MASNKTTITLKFSVDNNYGRSAKEKHAFPEDPIINACWVVNCALAAIEKSYKPGAPRLIEMTKIHRNLLHQIKTQLTPEQFEQTAKYFRILEEVPPISVEK